MANKIIQATDKSSLGSFSLKQFSSTEEEKGEKKYIMRSFAEDEEVSIQDAFSATTIDEPDTIVHKEDEISEKDYLPPSKLAKLEDNIVAEPVSMKKPQSLNEGFVESDMFCDINEESNPENQDLVEVVDDGSHLDGNLSSEEQYVYIHDLEDKVKALEKDKVLLQNQLDEANKTIEDKNNEITNIQSSIPPQLEESKEIGRQAGFEQGKQETFRQYEADKADYLSHIDSFNKESLKKIDELNTAVQGMDESIAETVLGFVKTIVGAERKFNDAFVVNLIKNNLDRLKDLKNISFTVNPADLDAVKAELPDYVVSTDSAMEKGSVNVHTKIGEVNLDSDTMIADLEQQINAKLKPTNNA